MSACRKEGYADTGGASGGLIMWASSDVLAISEANATYGSQRGLHPSHKLNLHSGEQVLQVRLSALVAGIPRSAFRKERQSNLLQSLLSLKVELVVYMNHRAFQ